MAALAGPEQKPGRRGCDAPRPCRHRPAGVVFGQRNGRAFVLDSTATLNTVPSHTVPEGRKPSFCGNGFVALLVARAPEWIGETGFGGALAVPRLATRRKSDVVSVGLHLESEARILLQYPV